MQSGTNRPALAAFADQAGKFSAMVSGLGLLGIAGIICWEVFARYVMNEPTTWVTEIATYMLVERLLGLRKLDRFVFCVFLLLANGNLCLWRVCKRHARLGIVVYAAVDT